MKALHRDEKSWFDNLRTKKILFSALRIFSISFISIFILVFILAYALYLIPDLQEKETGKATEISKNPDLQKDKTYKNQISLMTKDINRLSRKYNAFTSGQSYIVINTTDKQILLI